MQGEEGTGREGVEVDQLMEKDEKKNAKSKKRISGYKSCYLKFMLLRG